jgi:hypothetical protein
MTAVVAAAGSCRCCRVNLIAPRRSEEGIRRDALTLFQRFAFGRPALNRRHSFHTGRARTTTTTRTSGKPPRLTVIVLVVVVVVVVDCFPGRQSEDDDEHEDDWMIMSGVTSQGRSTPEAPVLAEPHPTLRRRFGR